MVDARSSGRSGSYRPMMSRSDCTAQCYIPFFQDDESPLGKDEGRMTPTPQIYLSFDGNCEAAFRFYEARLGATMGLMHPYANSPMASQVPSEWGSKIMHGSITLGGVTICGADSPPAGVFETPRGFRILLEGEDPADIERLYNALAENATIEMPLQRTFWSLSFGVLTDQFGIPWTLSCAQMPESTT
jgi:PhnB protein